MELRTKYKVFNYLDHHEAEDYLSTIHLVSQKFHISINESEEFVRDWYGGESNFADYFRLMKKLAELYQKNLSIYKTSYEFWSELVTELDLITVELLLIFPPKVWVDNICELLYERKSVLNQHPLM